MSTDPKRQLAAFVQTHLLELNDHPEDPWITSDRPVELQRITYLQTQVRVWTPRGPRYFIVQVREMM